MSDRAEDATWDAPDARTPAPPATPVLRTAGIAGPLDWLLEQARARRVDLTKLSVLDLVEQCVAAVDKALAAARDGKPEAPSLERLADWLVMAASLAWLRSGLLLPDGDPDAEAARDEAEALRRQLSNRERVRLAAAELDALPRLGRDTWARGLPADPASLAAVLPALLRAYARLLGPPPDPPTPPGTYRPRPPLLWPFAEILARMARPLPDAPKATDGQGVPLWHFLPATERLRAALAAAPAGTRADPILLHRSAMAGTLLASLELARQKQLSLQQERSFEVIRVEHCPVVGDVPDKGAILDQLAERHRFSQSSAVQETTASKRR